jgi:TRAP-type C4-dicarboxylate transport system permease large subunit
VTSCASTIDNLIPPSIGMIIFSAAGAVSVGALFTAGLLPGFLMAAALMLTVHVQARRRGLEPSSRPMPWPERMRAENESRIRGETPNAAMPMGMLEGAMRAGPLRRRLARIAKETRFALGARHYDLCHAVVTLPPGRARLATNPVATGSADGAITIGMVAVARFAASEEGVCTVTMAFTLSATSSAANWGRVSFLPSVQRASTARFLPST